MDNDKQPGGLRIRIGFARIFGGGGPAQGQLKPSLEITDASSGRTVTVELSGADIAEMLSGSEVTVPAENVSGFKAFRDFGKVHSMQTRSAKSEPGDYRVLRDTAKVKALPHVAAMIADLESLGYRCGLPSLNNSSVWTVHGRRYDEPA